MASKALIGIATLTLGLMLSVARAQDSDIPESDPPDRAARLAYIGGDVSMQPAGEEEWAPALLNRPLTTGDRLWTERGARVEIQVGQAAVRLSGDTGFSFLNLDDDTVQMRLTAGTIIVDVRELDDREQIEIGTPNIALSILRPGSYRVEVNDAGDATTVKVGHGEAEAHGPGNNTLVHSEQVVTFRGVEELVADWGKLGPADDFDEWSMERERRGDRLAASTTSKYVSPEVTGYDDLDEYGTWSSEPEYGYVWTPTRVSVGWSPYRYGRWVWISPWGYTWIDDSPWGYAPFHYGRWAHIRHRWCWVPGPRHLRPVYAPALVGWTGARGTYISWYPLGPRDVYMPHRRFSRHYVERVNFTNALILSRLHVRDAYDRRGPREAPRNRSVPDAITAVPRTAFTSGQRLGDRRVRFDERQMGGNQNDRDHDRGPDIAPSRESRLGGATRAHPRMAAALANRQVIVKREPPPSGARFTRRAPERVDDWQTQGRPARSPDDNRHVDPRSRQIAEAMAQRERDDRPARGGRAARDAAAPADRTPVRDPHSIAERVRQDRERQARENQLRESFRQRDEQQRDERQRDEQRRDAWRSSRDSQRASEAMRESAVRQLEQRQRTEQRERNEPREHPRMRQEPREQRQPERVERPRMEQPRQERPQQQERAPRQEPRPEPRPERGQSAREQRDGARRH